MTDHLFQSNRFGCPPFIRPFEFDTLRPTDQPPDSFLFWRWEWDDCLHGLMSGVMNRALDQDAVLGGDRSVRSFWARVPQHLKTIHLIVYAEPSQVPVTVSSTLRRMDGAPTVLALQQIRLALHFSTGLLQLHRSSFTAALKQSSEEPLLHPNRASVLVLINEACANVVGLVEILLELGPTVTRHIASPTVYVASSGANKLLGSRPGLVQQSRSPGSPRYPFAQEPAGK
jgi:hypothetical protein